jgi:hypothetical protein
MYCTYSTVRMPLLLHVHSFVACVFLVSADRAAVIFIGILSVRTELYTFPPLVILHLAYTQYTVRPSISLCLHLEDK